jgi:hypothetical protein
MEQGHDRIGGLPTSLRARRSVEFLPLTTLCRLMEESPNGYYAGHEPPDVGALGPSCAGSFKEARLPRR